MNPSTEPTRSVVIEKHFAHAPEKLWRALTDSALLAQWLLRNDFAPEIGREFRFRNEPVGGGTLLRMEHSGFQADQKAAYLGAQHGWQRFLGNLERLLDE